LIEPFQPAVVLIHKGRQGLLLSFHPDETFREKIIPKTPVMFHAVALFHSAGIDETGGGRVFAVAMGGFPPFWFLPVDR
jgi:hypothetical protein